MEWIENDMKQEGHFLAFFMKTRPEYNTFYDWENDTHSKALKLCWIS